MPLLMVRYALVPSHILSLFSHPHFLVLLSIIQHLSSCVILFFFESQLTGSLCHDDISYPDLEYIIHQNSHIFKLFSHLNMSVTLYQWKMTAKFHMTHATFGCLWILRLHGWKYRINHSDHFKMSERHLWGLAYNKCKKSEPMGWW